MSKVSDIVTQNILKKLQGGIVPWQKPWAGGSRPVNAISKKPYRGGNSFFLGLMPYGSNQWATFKQWHAKGASVRKGEKGTPFTLTMSSYLKVLSFSSCCQAPKCSQVMPSYWAQRSKAEIALTLT